VSWMGKVRSENKPVTGDLLKVSFYQWVKITVWEKAIKVAEENGINEK
jgi:hypothetical protein